MRLLSPSVPSTRKEDKLALNRKRRVAALGGLRSLNLAGDKVTDEGLKELAALKQLRKLVLTRTKVTDDGVAALEKALPDCKISR
jgi:hypothetical protein